jgi:PAS domain S-box-containing protein
MSEPIWQWTPYTLPLLAAAASSILLALHIVRRRSNDARSRTGALLLVASAVWTLGYALELSSVDLSAKILWAKTQYAGIVVFPLFWFVYALRYAGHGRWLTPRRWLLLAIVPLSTLVLAFTTEIHGLMWKRTALDTSGPFSMLVQDFGPALCLFLIYTNVLIIAGIVTLIRMFVHSPKLYRRQICAVLVGVSALATAVALDVLDLIPLGGLDLEPFGAALLAPIVAWGLFRLQLGDIVPVAHESIMRGLDDSILVLDEQDRILAANPAARDMIGELPAEVVGQPVAAVWPEWPNCTACAGAETVGRWEWTRERGDRRHTYEVNLSPIQDARDVTVSRIITLHDITERKAAEREIRERRRYLEGVLESAPDAIVTLDARGCVVDWNSAAQSLFGYTSAEAIGQDIDHLIAVPAILQEAHELTQYAMAGNKVSPTETVRYRQDGSPVHVIVAGAPICSTDAPIHSAGAPIHSAGAPIGAVVVYTDISERKRMEQELRALNEDLSALNEELERRVTERTYRLSQMNDELVQAIEEHEQAQDELLRRNRELLSLQSAVAATASSLDLPFLLDTFTWEMANLLGVERCTILSLDQDKDTLSVLACYDATNDEEHVSPEVYALADHPTRRWVLNERAARQMTIGQPNVDPAERRHLREKGIKCLLMQPMVFQDRVVGLVEVADRRGERSFTDQELSLAQLFSNQVAGAIENARLYERAQEEIAERLRAEERITASLREKEVLLKEIHHRVKNNLQVISSLLRLQSRSIDDQDILEIFTESQHRVRSMALIHEKLYRSHDLARVDFGSYIQDLASFLFRSYRAERGAVRLSVDADGVSLPIDTAVPCGLIINELISNSLKHAFADGREGEIRVSLVAEQEQRIRLAVSDNGVGFPEDVDFRRTPSLGLQLVNTLVDQLDAEIELYNGEGTRFEIAFAAP